MNERVSDQLEKVLALADSDQEGEALGALRMARRLLEREGLSFSHLATAVRRSPSLFSRKVFSPEAVRLEAKIDQLHDELDAHVAQNQSLSEQIEFWRRRAFELEQALAMNQAETARWKEMARETAERLWDLGQIARAEAFVADAAMPEDDAALSEGEDDSMQDVAPVLKAAG